MFCKGFSFLLLFQSLEATSAKPAQRDELSPCKGGACGQSLGMSILQVEKKQNRTKSVSPEEAEADDSDMEKKASNAKFNMVEHWQDLMQYDLFPAGDLSKGELVVSKEQWARAFDSLDKNADGQLDGHDLDGAYAETASHHLNVSQEDYRLAVASMAQKFPEFAGFMISHQPALVFFSETNTSAPLDAPVPDDKSMALFAQRTRKLALLEGASECQQAFGKFAYEAISLGLSFAHVQVKDYLGDEPPPDWMKQLYGVYQQVNKNLLKQVGEEIQAGNWQGAAGHLWAIVVELFNTGALTSLVQAALDEMSWWDWARTGVNMIATVIAHMKTAGWTAIAQLTYKIMVEGMPLAPLAFKAINKCQ